MGYGESLILLLLYHLYYLDKVSAVCSQSYQSYLEKGLRPDESPPHLPGQKVRYRCAYNRKVPGFQTVESTCVDNLWVISIWCETVSVVNFNLLKSFEALHWVRIFMFIVVTLKWFEKCKNILFWRDGLKLKLLLMYIIYILIATLDNWICLSVSVHRNQSSNVLPSPSRWCTTTPPQHHPARPAASPSQYQIWKHLPSGNLWSQSHIVI